MLGRIRGVELVARLGVALDRWVDHSRRDPDHDRLQAQDHEPHGGADRCAAHVVDVRGLGRGRGDVGDRQARVRLHDHLTAVSRHCRLVPVRADVEDDHRAEQVQELLLGEDVNCVSIAPEFAGLCGLARD